MKTDFMFIETVYTVESIKLSHMIGRKEYIKSFDDNKQGHDNDDD